MRVVRTWEERLNVIEFRDMVLPWYPTESDKDQVIKRFSNPVFDF
jgi:hypothetical protein